jgi:hypothetical protein
LKKLVAGVWTGLIWFGFGTIDGLLWMQKQTIIFHKMQGISWLIEELLAFQERLFLWSLLLCIVRDLYECTEVNIFWSLDCIYINGLNRNATTLRTTVKGAYYLRVPFIELHTYISAPYSSALKCMLPLI